MILLSKCVYTGVLIMFSPVSSSPLILMKRKVLGHKFSKTEAQKVVYFPSAVWSMILAPSIFLEIKVYQNVQNCFALTQ